MDERDDASRVLDAIAEARAEFAEALRRGDAAAASAVYTERATLLAPSAELIRGRKPIEAFWDAGIAAGVTGVELESLELDRQERLAYEIGRYALRLEPEDGGAVVDRGMYLLIHVRQQDGSWRRTVEMFSPAAPTAPTGRKENRDA